MKSVLKDLIGKQFGRWTVLSRSDDYVHKGKSYPVWNCKCSCGKEKPVIGNSLRSGRSLSCGCYNKERASLPPGEAGFNSLYIIYRNNAKRNARSFSLTPDEFRLLTKQNCYYCGIEPGRLFKGKANPTGYIYNGVDRRNNNEGYTLSNCVSCCWECNKMKADLPADQFDRWIQRVVQHHATT